MPFSGRFSEFGASHLGGSAYQLWKNARMLCAERLLGAFSASKGRRDGACRRRLSPKWTPAPLLAPPGAPNSKKRPEIGVASARGWYSRVVAPCGRLSQEASAQKERTRREGDPAGSFFGGATRRGESHRPVKAKRGGVAFDGRGSRVGFSPPSGRLAEAHRLRTATLLSRAARRASVVQTFDPVRLLTMIRIR